MKKTFLIIGMTALVASVWAQPQPTRGRIDIPDVGAYKTLKCDFHLHTVFSDGLVWPTVRVQEAYAEGLDVVAITDHLENQRFKKLGYVNGDHNTSYTLAKGDRCSSEVLVIRGAEITRGSMPPGHCNAIFLRDANTLFHPDNYLDAFKEAKEQNAFIFWNHPGWHHQQPDSTRWFPGHTQLLENGYMHGIEVCNGYDNEYYPEAHRWALEKNLTMLGNTDLHGLSGLSYDLERGNHRVMTLVLASEKSEKAVREALDARRTIVYFKDMLIGEEVWVRKLFEACVAVEQRINHKNNSVQITLSNNSDLEFSLVKNKYDRRLNYIRQHVIRPHEEMIFTVNLKTPVKGPFTVDFDVDNLLVDADKCMHFSIEVLGFDN